jgi:catechol 2,3-dioxygenase-like lactoylglutathione lyase family enzyme
MTSMAEKQRIEAITLPVADVDRAKAFYERAGWNLDYDTGPAPGIRVVQFTPTGSACSITFGTGMPQAEPGSYRNTYLVVSDIARVHAELVERGIEVSDIYYWAQERRTPGVDPNRADFGKYPELADPDGRTPGVDPNRADFGSYAEFADPDGNTWLIQEGPEPSVDRGLTHPACHRGLLRPRLAGSRRMWRKYPSQAHTSSENARQRVDGQVVVTAAEVLHDGMAPRSIIVRTARGKSG